MERMRRIETWARLGFAARGIVYLLLGLIALFGGKALSTGETVQAVEDLPGGAPLLVALAIGLFGYGLYKIYSSLLDLDRRGDDAKAWILRGAHILGGLAYWGLSLIAVKQLLTDGSRGGEAGRSSGSGGARQDAANQVAEAAGGDLLLAAIGLAVLALALVQLAIAWNAKFMNEMPGAPALVKPAGQIGYAARALVIAMVGYFIVQAGLDGERLRSFGDALAMLRDGQATLFKLVAGGLILFGLVSLVMAKYRRVADDDVVERVKANVPHGAV